MAVTIVRCSLLGCGEPATQKIAAPWKDGSHAELKTYGYACAEHAEPVLDYAEHRFKPTSFGPGESVGDIQSYRLEGV
jgi:hypothetical protein